MRIKIATLECHKNLVYRKPDEIIIDDYDGEMYKVVGKNIDFISYSKS